MAAPSTVTCSTSGQQPAARNLNDLGRIALRHELGKGDEILVEANTQRFRELQQDF
jgi:20S proteasome alpha/beta subunit